MYVYIRTVCVYQGKYLFRLTRFMHLSFTSVKLKVPVTILDYILHFTIHFHLEL